MQGIMSINTLHMIQVNFIWIDLCFVWKIYLFQFGQSSSIQAMCFPKFAWMDLQLPV